MKFLEEYLDKFKEKQGFEEVRWSTQKYYSLVCCENDNYDYWYFNIIDIIWDINSKQPARKILEWYALEIAINKPTYFDYTKDNIQ